MKAEQRIGALKTEGAVYRPGTGWVIPPSAEDAVQEDYYLGPNSEAAWDRMTEIIEQERSQA